MPELPEVETIKNVIEPQIKGKTIINVIVNKEKIVGHPKCSEFIEGLKGAVINSMSRRGKFTGIHLEDGRTIFMHYRMTGGLFVMSEDYEMDKHTHVIMKLDDGNEIRYVDSRAFGKFWLLGKDEEDTYTGMNKLGIEPFDDRLTMEYLKNSWSKFRKPIKECLLDQSVVTGIGNIYSDEILFTCKIDPKRKVCDLSDDELSLLAEKIPEELKFFIEKNVISKEDYLKEKGKNYRNTPFLRVYGHGGEPCTVCGTQLVKCTIYSRSSVYCPKCQK